MSLIRPFAGLRPAPSRAAEIAAPPYDVLSSEEARARAAGKPWSFLHISKPEIDLPAGTDPYAPEVYAKAAENLRGMLAGGVLARDPAPCYYVYRLVMGGHSQTGLVAAASVVDYDCNRIRKHEFTRPDKEDDRVRQIDALNAQTGPVLLAYPDAPQMDAILQRASDGAPDADVVADDGIRHTLWVIRDSATQNQITAAFDAMRALYIADGHHRSAAASRVAAARRAVNPSHTGAESYNYFLSVIFPHHQMKIMDYNRLMADLNGMDAEKFLQCVGRNFSVQPSAAQAKPGKPGEFGLYLPGQWYRLQIRAELIPPDDPVARLDVSLLQNHLIAPVLGITDPRRDKRIDFVGGIRGLAELEKRVDSGEMAAALALFATSMEDLMAVADANEVMPPKSTWFEPKLADGMVTHVLD
ncbi:MAG: hypothetical protein FD134_1456 [Gallionellaceae bacterium]|nr:MAG: hypothetical protein FD134_1456 [Gallionellaceae bacterium]